MLFKDLPIQRKLMRVILLISTVMLFVTCTAFFAYEIYTFRQSTVQKLSALGEVIAANSTAALAFDNNDDAEEILSALKADPHIVAACLYDKNNMLFSKYPGNMPDSGLAVVTSREGYHFEGSYLEGFQPVEEGSRRLGTLYLKSDLGGMYARLRIYGIVTLTVALISFLLSYLLSKILQKSISTPILALAETAKTVSAERDYSVRAVKSGNDELGSLTDSFNDMLQQIGKQNSDLKEFNQKLIASENQFRHTLDNMMEGAQIIDFDWCYKYVNDAMTKHGKYSKEELLGYTVMEKYPGIEQTDIYKVYQRCFNERVPIHLENEFIFPDKSKGWFELSFQPVPEGIFILSIDITERKKAEKEIKALNEGLEVKVKERTIQLEAVNEELESFSYSVSHDLRAPLRAVNGYAKILEEDYKSVFDSEGNRLLGVIQENANKMGTLIDDLLAFSRLGRKEVNRTFVNMTQLAENIFTEVNKATGNKAKIKINPLSPVMADYTLLSQVMTNLISNAVKYSSGKEKPSVEIKSEKKNGEMIYSVADNGAGFDMQYAAKLFGVFQRLHSAEEFEGTGVGLAIVKRIVAKHNGKVWANGEIGKGATFYFSLPDYETVKNN